MRKPSLLPPPSTPAVIKCLSGTEQQASSTLKMVNIDSVYALQRKNVVCRQSASFPLATPSQRFWCKATQFTELWHMVWVCAQVLSSVALCGTYLCTTALLSFICVLHPEAVVAPQELHLQPSRGVWVPMAEQVICLHTPVSVWLPPPAWKSLPAALMGSLSGLCCQTLLDKTEPTFNDAASVPIVTSIIFPSPGTGAFPQGLSSLSFHTYHSLPHCIATCHSK